MFVKHLFLTFSAARLLTYLISNQRLQEVETPEKKEDEETEISKVGKEEDHGDEGKTENPLEKYMKIILEERKKQETEVSFSHVCETIGFFLV